MDFGSLPPALVYAIDRACDDFEAAWGAGAEPRIEDYLGRVPEPGRSALLRALLATELELRRRRGEQPEPREYGARFPDDPEVVGAALGGPATTPGRPGSTAPPPDPVAAGLLFGLLALQNGFIDRDALLSALSAWVTRESAPLGSILVDRGALDADARAVLEAMARKHLEDRGDAGQCRAGLGSAGLLREHPGRLPDPGLRATLPHLAAPRRDGAGADATLDWAPGAGGRFRILRLHAQGGLGEVFVAVDTELHREVALKQIRPSNADDPESRARFVLEAELTGNLEHPGIVPVYGLGSDGDGRPYYAMRFVKGETLKDAIAEYHRDGGAGRDPGERVLALRALLGRFIDVCDAVAYAHSRGVLHRDLKPSNIIVGQYGEALVVDWGLAKVVGRSDGSAPEATLRPTSVSVSPETLPGSAIGTPGFMSPEQAEGRPDRIGPASDVYSLGATLYCLLTGRAPIGERDVAVVREKVRLGEFPPPRQVEPDLPRPLEAICLKAMARKPEDRYPTPRALAEDLERWLADEPVSAWPEPPSDRARRWMRRHRPAVTGVAVALLVALIGLGAVAVVQTRANDRLTRANAATTEAKHQAEAALAEATEAKKATEAALAQSEESRKQAEAVSTFLTEAFRSPDPVQDGRVIKVVDVLDRAADKVDKEFSGSPATRGALLDALGQTYYGLGLYDRAVKIFARVLSVREAALGPNHVDTLTSRNDLAVACERAGRIAEAIALHEQALEQREAKLGPDHVDTLTSRNNLAVAYERAGRTAEAIALHEQALEQQEAKLGPDHIDTLTSRSNLARAYERAGRIAEAIALHEQTLKRREAKLGPDHPHTLTSRNNLAVAYERAGRTAEAVALHERTLRLMESRLGPDHPDSLASRGNLARAYEGAGRTAEAIVLHERTLRLMESRLGPDHPHTLTGRNNLARAYETLGRWAEAEALRRDNLARRRKAVTPDSPFLAGDLAGLGSHLLKRSRWSEAEPLLRECLAIQEKAMPDDWSRFNAMSLLGGVLLAQGQYAEAEPLLVRGYEGMMVRQARIPASNKPRLLEAAERIVRLYEAWGRPDKATEWKSKVGLTDLPADVFTRP
jgi:serine/threonine protein kinase/tetratricopeptide (TPR) repeat protein